MNQTKCIDLPTSNLNRFTVFPDLKGSEIATLLGAGELKNFKRGQPLFNAGDIADAFFLVLSGAFKLVKESSPQSEGHPTLMEIIGPGETIGLILMQTPSQNHYPVTATAMIDSEVLQLPKTFYETVWAGDVVLQKLGAQQMARRVQRIQQDRSIQRFPLPQKVAYFLCEKIRPVPGIKVTRQEIADGVGASTESVIRVLSEWSKEGLIATQNHEITIYDFDKIRSLANA